VADDMTLLAHLVPTLGRKPEIIATKALGYILSTSQVCKHALEDLLKISGTDIGTISRVKTEAKYEELGTPDLACFDQHGVERVLIEAKFWAGLTKHQPVTYLKRLPKDKTAALLFVAPLARFETLWDELCRQVVKSSVYFGPDEKKDENLWIAEVGGKHRLMLTSWKALLENMADRASRQRDSCVVADIGQLLGLTQRMDEDAFLPLRSEEFGPEFPRRVLGLQRLTRDVINHLRGKEWVDMSGLLEGALGSHYMRLAGAGAHITVYFELWARARDTPLWLIFDPWGGDTTLRVSTEEVRRRLAPLRQEVPPGIIDEGRRLLVPINLPLGVEYDSVLNAVVERLEYIARLIDSPETTS